MGWKLGFRWAALIGAVELGCVAGDAETSGESAGTGETPAACVQAGWDDSKAAYDTLDAESGGDYWYAITTYEYLEDFTWSCAYRTTIEVVAGIPVRRTFELASVAEGTTEDQCTGTPFVEEGEAVGSTEGSFAAAPSTMEQLYAGCCDLLAIEPAEDYSFLFKVDDDGVVKTCYALYETCAEGCEASVDGFSGFELESFGFGAKP